ncbi:hypothetical protein E2C01_015897 [Portunus trituberculatus]|uniref:Uncharacterized protein n=1 Tax=Portunus trituberculatus TaxID=210409 RepID=A0A5B7DN24_PORTR|nr:hypothetical protein [Portunus trituberculatus]
MQGHASCLPPHQPASLKSPPLPPGPPLLPPQTLHLVSRVHIFLPISRGLNTHENRESQEETKAVNSINSPRPHSSHFNNTIGHVMAAFSIIHKGHRDDLESSR